METSLAFTQTLAKGNRLWQLVGMLTLSDDGLAVEWRSDEYERAWGKANYAHVARAEIQNVLIPWSSIERIVFRGRLFKRGRLHVHARTLLALDKLPGANGSEWWVQVARPERRRAREFQLQAAAQSTAIGKQRSRQPTASKG